MIVICIVAGYFIFTKERKENVNNDDTANNISIQKGNETSMNNQTNNTQNSSNEKVEKFNFETKTVKLNSGYEMPLNGIGTYSLTGDTCYNAITSALNSGVRLIDTAYMYGNEEEIGKAIKDSNVPREEIFVITKIYPSQFDDPESAIEMAFDKLQLHLL